MSLRISDPELVKRLRRFPYLVDYLRSILKTQGSLPKFLGSKIPSELRRAMYVNVLYEVDSENGIFIHVYTPRHSTTGYRVYRVIEPPRPPNELLELIEIRLAEEITEKDIATDLRSRKEILLKKLNSVLTIVNRPPNYRSLLYSKRIPRRIPVYRGHIEHLRYHFIRDKAGLGAIEALIKDPYIEDISYSGIGCIHIVHKIFGPLETNICFNDEDAVTKFLLELSERIGKPVSSARPIVDATLPDGSRINIVYGSDVSLRGSNFTIRKFTKVPISIAQLVDWNTMDEYIAAYLWMLLLEGMSGFVCGETASGKTTTLNASIIFIRPTAKIVSIEDTAEIVAPHPNWVRELTRDTGNPETSVTMFDLLKAALRQRPNYIIVGEIRGAEGNVAFQAMQSVSWDTPILIRRNGSIKLIPIGKFINQYYRDGEEGIPKFIKDVEVLTITRSYKVVFMPIKYVLRHRHRGKLYKVTTSDGSSVLATGSHSFMVINEYGELVEKRTTELKPGEFLVTFSGSDIRLSEEKNFNEIIIDLKKISHIKARDFFESKVVLDNDLAFIMGIYLACGYVEHKAVNESYLVFHIRKNSSRIIPKVINFFKKLNAKIKIEEKDSYIIVKIYHEFLPILFSQLIGVNPSDKHIPEILWYAPKKIVKEFLSGYISSLDNNNINYSEWSIYETAWLSKIHGLNVCITNSKNTSLNIYDISKEVEYSNDGIPIYIVKNIYELLGYSNVLSQLLKKYRELLPKNLVRDVISNIDEKKVIGIERFVNNIKNLLNSHIRMVKIESIEEVDYDGYVYDISVEGEETFLGGSSPILLHNTGHPVLSTFHAATVERLIQRLTSPPINVPKTHIDNLNFVIIQSAVYREGVIVRRILNVNEILGYDSRTGSVNYIPIFTWDPITDRFTFRGRGSSYLLEEKIGVIRGLSRRNMNLIYDELQLRAAILKELVKKKVFNHFNLFKFIARVFMYIDEKAKKGRKEELEYIVIDTLEEILLKLRLGELKEWYA